MKKLLILLVTFLYINVTQAQLAKTSTEQYKASFEKSIDITFRLKWLGMMESNHHKQIQSLPHYHYANPQLLKMERVVRFELTTSSLENSYSTN